MDKDAQDQAGHDKLRRLALKLIGGSAVACGTSLAGGIVPAGAAEGAATGPDNAILDVAIIGAGLSGLTAARDLDRAGCGAFVVLEARDRVGGRTYNHDLGGGRISEGGGEWIGPGQTAIADLARELGIATFKSYYKGKTAYLVGDACYAEDLGTGGAGAGDAIVAKLNAMARAIPEAKPWTATNAAQLDSQTIGQWLAGQNLSDTDKIAFDMSVATTFGAPPASLSLLHYLAIIKTANCDLKGLESMENGAQERRFAGGSQLLSLRMAQELGDRVRLSSPVRKISGWNGAVVSLFTDHGVVRARKVIGALSPALLNQIEFDPPLPAGRANMQKLWPAHSPMRKTVHVYRTPFWRDAGYNAQISQIDGPLLWCCDNSPEDGSLGVINAFVKPGMLSHDAKVAEKTLSALYARALGDEALKPIQFHDLDWGKVDQWTLACTAAMPPGFLTAWGQYLHPPIGQLIWAGTETAEIWAGAMDGAVRAGHRAALQALGALRAV